MKLTMSSILLAIQVMLSNPVLDNAVNLEAAEMLKNNISLYRKRVIQCVTTSQSLEAVPSAEKKSLTSIKFCAAPEKSTPEQPRKIANISYEDYYLTWFKIATSRVEEEFKSPVFEDPDFIANLYDWKATNVAKGEWNTDIHRILFSEFIEKRKTPNILEVKENNRSVTPAPSEYEEPTTSSQKTQSRNQEEEHWEQEVEDLVTWSKNLG